MTVAITGATGLVGAALAAFLTTGGHDVLPVVRRPQSTGRAIRWDPAAGDWVETGDSLARNQVRQGIRMARKLVAPDLLLLEVQAPEVAP